MRQCLLVAALCAGCAALEPPPEPKAPPPKVEIPAATDKSEPMPPLVDEAPVLPEVREPADVACRIVESGWSYPTLRLKDGGAVFAKITSAPTSLAFASGEPRAAIAVFDDANVLLRGVVAHEDIRIYTRAATALRGFLIPKKHTVLAWIGGGGGKLRVGVDAKDDLVPPTLVDEGLGCDKLGLNVQDFEARDQVTKQAKLPEREIAREGAELALTRGGDAVARLRDGVRVELVLAQGKHSKILRDHHQYVLFGWVASADLRPPQLGAGYGTGHGRLAGRYVGKRGARKCARDLTLIAEVGSERAIVGVLRQGAPFLAESLPKEQAESAGPPPRSRRRELSLVPISLPLTRWLEPVEGARVLVLEEEFKDCDPPPAPPAP